MWLGFISPASSSRKFFEFVREAAEPPFLISFSFSLRSYPAFHGMVRVLVVQMVSSVDEKRRNGMRK